MKAHANVANEFLIFQKSTHVLFILIKRVSFFSVKLILSDTLITMRNLLQSILKVNLHLQ